jgi:hypothetical protein
MIAANRITIIVEPAADSDGVPVEIRLRRLLKFSGRCCRLKCLEIHPTSSRSPVGRPVGRPSKKNPRAGVDRNPPPIR